MNPEMTNTDVSRTPNPPRPLTITTHEKITAAFCALFCVVLFWLVMSAFALFICSQQVQEFCQDPDFPLLVRDGGLDHRAYGPRCCTPTLSACKEPAVTECETFGLWNEWILYSLCALVVVGGSWAMYTVVTECRRAIAVTTEEDADRFIRENL
jgi:hypothetical protein